MSDEDADRLRGALDMALHLHPKHPAVVPPLGVLRLDFHSGLFLVHGAGERQWALEGRTWGPGGRRGAQMGAGGDPRR